MSENQFEGITHPRAPSLKGGGVKGRLAFKLLLFLLAGAIINVAVAWGCLIFPASQRYVYAVPRVSHADLEWWNTCGFNTEPQETEVWAALGRDVKILGGFGSKLNEEAAFTRAGLPVRSVTALWLQKPYQQREFRDYLKVSFSGSSYFLPLRPIWPGFAINTIFYAAIVWGLFAVPGVIRRRVRRKRGQCAACGYSLRGRGTSGGKCTECGAMIPGTGVGLPCNGDSSR